MYSGVAEANLRRFKRRITCPNGENTITINQKKTRVLVDGKKPVISSYRKLKKGVNMPITKKKVNTKSCLEYTFTKPRKVDEVVFVNMNSRGVDTFTVKYMDGGKWKYVKKDGKPQVFEIFISSVRVKMPRTSAIRLYPQTWPGKSPYFRYAMVLSCDKN